MRQLKITKQVTNRDTPSLDKYLQEIGKVKLITAQEEVELDEARKREILDLEKALDRGVDAFTALGVPPGASPADDAADAYADLLKAYLDRTTATFARFATRWGPRGRSSSTGGVSGIGHPRALSGRTVRAV